MVGLFCRRVCVGLAAVALVAVRPVNATCTLDQIVELPVTMQGLEALAPAKINGRDARFVIDSGAFYSLITPGAAAQFALKRYPTALMLEGVGGAVRADLVKVAVFTLAGVPIKGVDFLVAGGEFAPADGLLGMNVLDLADVEYDFADGVTRLMKPKDCSGRALAYWAGTEPYSTLRLEADGPGEFGTFAEVTVNGVKLRAVFDTGANRSGLSLAAAKRVGLDMSKARPAGLTRGEGRRMVRAWIAPVRYLKIGQEEVRHSQLLVADYGRLDFDMLIGADFFLSHRVFVANSQNKLYFTYNGGPVFALSAPSLVQAGENAAPKPSSPLQASEVAPADAAQLERRGAALAARLDFAPAIADLTAAVALAPRDESYRYQLALAHLGAGQRDLARADLDQTLGLAPADARARVTRAALRLAAGDSTGAAADLAAADKAAARTADLRLALGAMLIRLNAFARAVDQLDLWIAAHPDDARQGEALNQRCWARGLWNRDLPAARRDCDKALRSNPKVAAFLDSRGLVRLRLGDYAGAIGDYDAALALQPRIGWSLYGRGLAELKAGEVTKGRADLAAAAAIAPKLPARAALLGLAPPAP